MRHVTCKKLWFFYFWHDILHQPTTYRFHTTSDLFQELVPVSATIHSSIPIAQIEGLGLLYKNQVSLSWNRSKNRSKIGLKVCHHPQNSNSIWKFFLNLPRIDRFGPERLYLIILRNYRPFFANLGRNEWLKLKKSIFAKKWSYWFLGDKLFVKYSL